MSIYPQLCNFLLRMYATESIVAVAEEVMSRCNQGKMTEEAFEDIISNKEINRG